jgi:hypothetical protein
VKVKSSPVFNNITKTRIQLLKTQSLEENAKGWEREWLQTALDHGMIQVREFFLTVVDLLHTFYADLEHARTANEDHYVAAFDDRFSLEPAAGASVSTRAKDLLEIFPGIPILRSIPKRTHRDACAHNSFDTLALN